MSIENEVIDVMIIDWYQRTFMRGYIPRRELNCISVAGGIPALKRPVYMIIPSAQAAQDGEIFRFTDALALIAKPK